MLGFIVGVPRLAPWAVIFRRFAAHVGGRVSTNSPEGRKKRESRSVPRIVEDRWRRSGGRQFSCVPTGRSFRSWFVYPALKRRAIFSRPYGTISGPSTAQMLETEKSPPFDYAQGRLLNVANCATFRMGHPARRLEDRGPWHPPFAKTMRRMGQPCVFLVQPVSS